jgi:adenosine kinase
MSILVSGSLAFDTIFVFPGRFADQILPDRVHNLNVSFLVPTMRREPGGCAGNIAYSLAQLGSTPVLTAAAGSDGAPYVERLRKLGIDADAVRIDATQHTAQAIILTDADNNQISAFHPGAMNDAHHIGFPQRDDITLAIVGPDGREAMITRAHQLQRAGVPFVFDPGQGLPMFDGPALLRFVEQATWVAVNDYEAGMLTERTGLSMKALSERANLRGVIVTLGAEGCEVWQQGVVTMIPGQRAPEVVDPTGCGDAFRAGMLHGLESGWSLPKSCALGNRLGATKIAHRGGQTHAVDRAALVAGLV